MPLDIIGPGSNTPNVTTSRPPNDATFGAQDTWFKDCTSPDAQDGTKIKASILNRMIAQLRRAIRGMGIDEDNADDDMLLKAIKKAGSTSTIINQFAAFLPIFPEIETVDGKFALTASTGQIVINAGQTWIHRGAFQKSTDVYDPADRTFATVANKTYHLRWRWNGPSTAPTFHLFDLADSGYNSAASPETHVKFDTTFDDMLIAKIVTNGANALTVTPLVNRAKLDQAVSNTDHQPLSPATLNVGTFGGPSAVPYFTNPEGVTHTLNWSRRPEIHWQDIGLFSWNLIVQQFIATRYSCRPLVYFTASTSLDPLTGIYVGSYYAKVTA